MKKIIILMSFLLFLFSINNAESQSKKNVFMPGEDLNYEVSFMGIKLGSIRIISEDVVDLNGRKVNKVKCYMNSYSGIPFVDLEAVFDSWMDVAMTQTHQFKSKMKLSDGTYEYQETNPNYEIMEMNFVSRRGDTVYKKLNRKLERRINDGASIFFLARQFVDRGETIRVPTLIDEHIYPTVLNFHGRPEKISINSIDYPVSVRYFDGRAEWKGIYGLNGYFQGWFSNDEASVPIKASMNVYVGSVNIELIEWNRPGWSPPRAK
jgi:hypothetical protein